MARCLALVNDVEAAINELKEFLTLPEVFNIADVKADTCFRYIFASKEWSEFWRGFEPDSEKLVLAELEYLLKQKEFTEVLHDNNSFSNSRYTYMAELMKTDALIELKQYKEALKKVNGILKDTLSYELLLRRAEVFSAMNEYIKAVIDISDVIELNPYEIDYYLQRAVASNNAQIYEQAISDLRYYLRFFEDHEEVWYKLSVVLLNAGINSEAVDVLSKLIAMNSGNELYFLLRAETYSNLTNYTGAVSDYLMALDLNPRNADTYISLGWCKHRLDDNAKACYYWHKAAHLGHPEAEFLLQQYCK